MKIDKDKAISFLLSEKFRRDPHARGKNFNEWCEEKNLTTKTNKEEKK